MRNRSRLPYWQIAAFFIVAILWLALSILLILSRGDVEAYLLNVFKDSVRNDAFFHMKSTFLLMWIGHACFLAFGVTALVMRKPDLFTVLIIGPIFALLVAITSQQWADPDWNTLAGVCFIGWIVGIVSGGGYSVYRLCARERTTGK